MREYARLKEVSEGGSRELRQLSIAQFTDKPVVFKEPKIYALPNKPNNYGRLCQIMYEMARTVDPVRWVHTGDYEEGVQNLMIGCCAPGDTDMKRKEVKPQIAQQLSQQKLAEFQQSLRTKAKVE